METALVCFLIPSSKTSASKFSPRFPSYYYTGTSDDLVHNHNDAALIHRFLKGDREAFGALYGKYRGRLYGYCYRLLQERTATEDVVQSTFAKALESVHFLDKPESFYYWIFTIARNEVYGVLRATRSNGTVELTDDVWDEVTPHDTVVGKETVQLVEECLSRLKVEYREVLVFRHFEQLSYAEISTITGDTISSVESRIHKARKALIKQLAPYLESRRIR